MAYLCTRPNSLFNHTSYFKVKTKTAGFEPKKFGTVNHNFKIKLPTMLVSLKPTSDPLVTY